MAGIPTSAEIEEIQNQLQAIHNKMHDYAKLYPSFRDTFIGTAVDLTDAAWKLDDIVQRAKWAESRNV